MNCMLEASLGGNLKFSFHILSQVYIFDFFCLKEKKETIYFESVTKNLNIFPIFSSFLHSLSFSPYFLLIIKAEFKLTIRVRLEFWKIAAVGRE